MGSLGNIPQRLTVLTLAARKSYAFGLQILRASNKTPIDLTGATLRMVIAKPKYQGGTVLVDRDATLLDAALGLSQFELQASDLDLVEAEYPFSITLVAQTGYSTLIFDGIIDLRDNTDTASTASAYAGINPSTNLAAYLDEGDLVTVEVAQLDGLSLLVDAKIIDFTNEANAIRDQSQAWADASETSADSSAASATAAAASATSAAASAQVAQSIAWAAVPPATVGRGHLQANQVVPPMTMTVFDLVESFDPDAMHDAAHPSRYTISVGGWYQVHARASSAANGAGIVQTRLLKNGFLLGGAYKPSPSDGAYGVIGDIVHLDAGDYLELGFYQNTPADVTVYGDSQSTYLALAKIGD